MKQSYQLFIFTSVISLMILTGCSKRYVDGYYKAFLETGGSSIELFENGKFKYIQYSDWDHEIKGDGFYYIKGKKMHLSFSDYDTLYLSIIQEVKTENQKMVKIEITPVINDNVNCYNLYLKDQVNDSDCKCIRNGEPIYIDKNKLMDDNFLTFNIDSAMCRINMILENLKYETIEYDLKKYENQEFTKKILYSDIAHRIEPNTKWVWTKDGNNLISDTRLLLKKIN